MTATAPLPTAVPSTHDASLDALWLPFTANNAFKHRPRLLVDTQDMHYVSDDGRQILDGDARRVDRYFAATHIRPATATRKIANARCRSRDGSCSASFAPTSAPMASPGAINSAARRSSESAL